LRLPADTSGHDGRAALPRLDPGREDLHDAGTGVRVPPHRDEGGSSAAAEPGRSTCPRLFGLPDVEAITPSSAAARSRRQGDCRGGRCPGGHGAPGPRRGDRGRAGPLDRCRWSTESPVGRGGQRPGYDEHARPNLVEPHQVRRPTEQSAAQLSLAAVRVQVAHVSAGQQLTWPSSGRGYRPQRHVRRRSALTHSARQRSRRSTSASSSSTQAAVWSRCVLADWSCSAQGKSSETGASSRWAAGRAGEEAWSSV